MVTQYLDGKLRALKFRTPQFESFNNSTKFLVIYLVVALGRVVLAREVCDRVKQAVFTLLG